MDADGSNKRLLLDRSPLPISFPEWSPDGEQIVFVGPRTLGILDLDVFTFDLSTSEERNLTHSDQSETSASWSPFGQRIIYAQRTETGRDALFSMASDGSDTRKISDEPGSFAAASPNGKALAFVGERSGQLMRMGRDGSEVRKLTRGLDVRFPDWQPR